MRVQVIGKKGTTRITAITVPCLESPEPFRFQNEQRELLNFQVGARTNGHVLSQVFCFVWKFDKNVKKRVENNDAAEHFTSPGRRSWDVVRPSFDDVNIDNISFFV